MLALLAKEHAYLEGPPGVGKSLLAETLAKLSGARVEVVPFHRDIREVDLLGDAVLRRERRGRLEILRRDVVPGPLLEAEVAILEDLPRAPGEALGPLLRILAARRALGADLPLETAVATGPPDEEGEDTPVDPLEPSQLDRFAIQVRMPGLLTGRRFREARLVLDRAARQTPALSEQPFLDEDGAPLALTSAVRKALQERAASLAIPQSVRDGYADLLSRMRARLSREDDALLSDRTFGVVVWRIVRAHATLRNAPCVSARDLRAIRYMAARRIPSELLQELEDAIEELLGEAGDEQVQVAVSGSETIAGPAMSGEGVASDAQSTAAVLDSEDEIYQPDPERRVLTQPAQVERLMKALVGRIERGRIEPDSDPGGQPRAYRPLRRLDDLLDGDLVEAMLYAEGRLPGSPRTYDRKRQNAGGAIVVLRDISASMAGTLAEWAGEVVAGVVRVAGRRRMRVGYVEFHHKAIDHLVGGRLLHRSYRRLYELAGTARTLGQTNYEDPLRVAIEALRGGMGRNRHVVMLTDGLPIIGDPSVRRERAEAKRLGVALHTVFLGSGECPPVLDDLSRETGGLRFQARPDHRGQLAVEER